MKGWLATAVARSAEYGPSRSTVGRWVRWLAGRDDPVDTRFQSADEPYPRHWRTPPTPWPSDAITTQPLQRAVRALPDPWRAVLLAGDGDRVSAERVATDRGLTMGQQRRILNEARAAVRDALAAQVRR
jgi:DNA-directed RNA polymerase specialized sigma24 family protein